MEPDQTEEKPSHPNGVNLNIPPPVKAPKRRPKPKEKSEFREIENPFLAFLLHYGVLGALFVLFLVFLYVFTWRGRGADDSSFDLIIFVIGGGFIFYRLIKDLPNFKS